MLDTLGETRADQRESEAFPAKDLPAGVQETAQAKQIRPEIEAAEPEQVTALGPALRRLRQLEEENSRLKRLVADLSLDKHVLSEALRKKV